MLSAWSAAVADIYIASRHLYYLARCGHAPDVLADVSAKITIRGKAAARMGLMQSGPMSSSSQQSSSGFVSRIRSRLRNQTGWGTVFHDEDKIGLVPTTSPVASSLNIHSEDGHARKPIGDKDVRVHWAFPWVAILVASCFSLLALMNIRKLNANKAAQNAEQVRT